MQMLKLLYFVIGYVAIATLSFTLIPPSDAQITELEFQKGRARTACRNQAEQQGLRVNTITVTVPVMDDAGQMVGSEVIMNVSRRGSSAYDVRCNFDNASMAATIFNLPNPGEGTSAAPPTEGTFEGRGLARGSVFGNEQTTDAQLDMNGSNFSFSLAAPSGTGAQVNYIGTVSRTRRAGSPRSNSGFILQGRVRSFSSSANGLQIIHATGNCEIEVFDARVISSSCNTRLRDSATRFDGLQQF
jgi:hypothetical protein